MCDNLINFPTSGIRVNKNNEQAQNKTAYRPEPAEDVKHLQEVVKQKQWELEQIRAKKILLDELQNLEEQIEKSSHIHKLADEKIKSLA